MSQNTKFHLIFSQNLERTINPTKERCEPYKDGRKQDDCTSLLNERPTTFPHRTQNISNGRNVVCRQFHNERSRIASEHLGLLQHNTRNNDCCHTDEVSTGCNPSRTTEDCTCNHCDERLLCTTRNKGSGHNGHTTVTFIFNRSGSHNTRDTTTSTNQNRDKGLTRQTELPEDTIHNECNTSHITASFQDCQQDEQYQHLRNETQYCTNTGNNTIQNQALQPVCTVDCFQTVSNQNRNTRNPNTIICRIRFASCKQICCCVQVIHGSGFRCHFQCLFIFYIIAEVCMVILFKCKDCILCSFTIISVCFGINVAFQCFGICTLFAQICNIAINDCIGIAIFIRSIIIRTGSDSQQMPAISEQAIICPVCCSTSDGYHRNIVNQEHDHCKNRQTQEPVGNDLVNLI